MDGIDRLKLLSEQMNLEPAEDVGTVASASCPKLTSKVKEPYISDAILPNGKRIQLLKTLLTSACERNCFYCPFRAGRDFRRATFKPEELARTFMSLHTAGIAQGTFLSSGIVNGGRHTQDLLLDTAEILRIKLGYRGYIHLKIMPGAERAQVERAMQLADRVSVNLEAPNSQRLQLLAPRKEFMEELIRPLRWVEEIRRSQPATLGWNGRWPSSTTQFVVGAVGESDLELLTTTEKLYRTLNMHRAYYSAFHPFPDTPLENHPAENLIRQNRLYQASFLLRDYGFDLEELPLDVSGNLPLDSDPKLAWARSHLSQAPVEVNRADRHQLLRIPGIGPKGVNAILSTRRQVHITDVSQLSKIGINTNKISAFILINGRRPAYQTSFFSLQTYKSDKNN